MDSKIYYEINTVTVAVSVNSGDWRAFLEHLYLIYYSMIQIIY